MKQHIYIKNMVCLRCKHAVEGVFKSLGVEVLNLNLGDVLVREIDGQTYLELEKRLKALGFEIMKNEDDILVEQIKTIILETLADRPNDTRHIPDLLSRIPKSYSILSKLFSRTMGITIENYVIRLKIEKVKELLQLGQLQFSEIADVLGYTSGSHLARQFKNQTGMSMTDFKNLQNGERKNFDKIV
ncbi:helix-turn-helix domain-containing protein [Formosa sp. A9]|uniref:helix-turn-helix domain-containing protein n=1 Tax=Formosa sp. A9 TaxID=3442641 RepID=UPI003EBFE5FE